MNSITAPMSATFAIDGMSCGHCVAQVTKTLSAVPGIQIRSVDIGIAQVSAEDSKAVQTALASLAEAGYTARTTQAASVSSPNNAPKSGGCCGGASAAGSKTSCCG